MTEKEMRAMCPDFESEISLKKTKEKKLRWTRIQIKRLKRRREKR